MLITPSAQCYKQSTWETLIPPTPARPSLPAFTVSRAADGSPLAWSHLQGGGTQFSKMPLPHRLGRGEQGRCPSAPSFLSAPLLCLCHLQWPDRNAVAILVHLPRSPLLIPGSPRSPIPILPNKKLIPQRCPSHPALPPHCLQPVTQVLLHRQLRQSHFSSKYPCGFFKHLGTNQTQCKFSFLTPYSLK